MVRASQLGQQVSSSRVMRAKASMDPLSYRIRGGTNLKQVQKIKASEGGIGCVPLKKKKRNTMQPGHCYLTAGVRIFTGQCEARARVPVLERGRPGSGRVGV